MTVQLTLTSPFRFGDRVHIDGDASLLGTVTALLFRPSEAYPTVEVAWLHNGVAQNAWIEAWRLDLFQRAPEPDPDNPRVVPLRRGPVKSA